LKKIELMRKRDMLWAAADALLPGQDSERIDMARLLDGEDDLPAEEPSSFGCPHTLLLDLDTRLFR